MKFLLWEFPCLFQIHGEATQEVSINVGFEQEESSQRHWNQGCSEATGIVPNIEEGSKGLQGKYQKVFVGSEDAFVGSVFLKQRCVCWKWRYPQTCNVTILSSFIWLTL